MGEILSKLFIDVEEIPQNGYGMVQLIFLFCVYAFILFKGANLISDGSELLLLVPQWAGLIGSIVLPFLGTVPDTAIVIFSGLGDLETVKQQIRVGVGALAGSTILLITIPWAMSIIAGRVSINENGERNYNRPNDVKKEEFKKLRDEDKSSLTRSGISVDPVVRKNAKFMLLSMLPYLFVQIPAFFSGCAMGDGSSCDSHIIRWICLGCFIVSQDKIDQEIEKSLRNGLVSISAVIANEIESYCQSEDSTSSPLIRENPELLLHVQILLRSFFYRYDMDHSGEISVDELRALLRDLGEPMGMREVKLLLERCDVNQSGALSFDEFCQFVIGLVDCRASGELVEVACEAVEEEELEVPSDLSHLTPQQQQRRIILRSFGMMLAGTALVILFSDPVVDVLDNFGPRIHVNSFYISFILAPLISNASEILASYVYSKKCTIKSATIAISTLLGSAIMNNTLCLGVFFLLIFMRGLEWLFSAEALAVLFVEICVTILAFIPNQTMLHAVLLLCLYPFSIFLVWILEYFGLN